jgi:hypothetical protein
LCSRERLANWFRDEALEREYQQAWRKYPVGRLFIPQSEQEAGFSVLLAEHRGTGISADEWMAKVFGADAAAEDQEALKKLGRRPETS